MQGIISSILQRMKSASHSTISAPVTRVAQKVADQNFTCTKHQQFNLMLPLQLIPYHITINRYYISQPFRHRPAFLINKMLRNQTPTLHNDSFVVWSSQCGSFFRCCFGGCQQFSIGEISGEEAQLKKYSRLFSSFHYHTMLRFFALPCPLSPSSSKTKSCFSNSHGFTTGSRIWLMYTWSDILPFVLPDTL